jgi:hypothetical protein
MNGSFPSGSLGTGKRLPVWRHLEITPDQEVMMSYNTVLFAVEDGVATLTNIALSFDSAAERRTRWMS